MEILLDNNNTPEQKSKIISQLEEALGIKPQETQQDVSIVPYKESKDNSHNDDYEFTRNTQKELYKLGFSSLAELKELAVETSDVKYFQALAALLATMKDVSGSVVQAAKTKSEIELNKSKIGIQKEAVINGNITQTNQSIFVGSAADLSKFLDENNATLDNIENVIIENASS